MTSEKKPKKTAERPKGARASAAVSAPLAIEEGTQAYSERDQWHERASFRVGFYSIATDERLSWQTRAYRDETEAEATWPDIAGADLLEWMRSQADMPAPAEPAPAESIPEPAAGSDKNKPASRQASPDLLITISALGLEEVMVEQPTGAQVKQLRAQMDFQLAGIYASPAAAAQMRYTGHFTAYDLETGAALALGGDQQRLDPALLDYSVAAVFDIPEIGIYQIIGTVVLTDRKLAAVSVGPRLTVEPADL